MAGKVVSLAAARIQRLSVLVEEARTRGDTATVARLFESNDHCFRQLAAEAHAPAQEETCIPTSNPFDFIRR